MPSIPFPHRSAVHHRFMILFIISHFHGVIKIFFIPPLPPQILPLGNGDEGGQKRKKPPRRLRRGGLGGRIWIRKSSMIYQVAIQESSPEPYLTKQSFPPWNWRGPHAGPCGHQEIPKIDQQPVKRRVLLPQLG